MSRRKKTLNSIEDIDIMKRPVNGCAMNDKGEIIRVHLYGNYYLDVKTGILTNQYNTGTRQATAAAVKDAVRRANLWRKCWDACPSEQ